MPSPGPSESHQKFGLAQQGHETIMGSTKAATEALLHYLFPQAVLLMAERHHS